MPENHQEIPAGAKKFTAPNENDQLDDVRDNEIDIALNVDEAKSGEMEQSAEIIPEKPLIDFEGMADDLLDALDKAASGNILQNTSAEKINAEKSGLLINLSKHASKLGKGIIAAAMLAGAERASADWTEADEQTIMDVEKSAQKSFDRLDQELKKRREDENRKISEIKKVIVDTIERKYPNSRAIVEKQINILDNDLHGLPFSQRLQSLDEFGKIVLSKLNGEKPKKTYSNDWRGEVDKKADQAQEHMERLTAAFKKFYDKKISYSEAIKTLESEIEPGTIGQLNGLHFERKKDGDIYIQYMKVTPESRARIFK